MSVNIDDFAAKLDKVKKKGSGFIACCPAHNDKNPSMGFKEGDDGRILVTCYAGCPFDDIVRALGMEAKDFMPPSEKMQRQQWSRQNVENVYDYHRLDGKMAYQVVRKPGKKFMQRRRDDSGAWVWNMEGVERLLFGLPAVVKAIEANEPVYLCEGEEDVLAMRKHGVTATTITGGVLKQAGDRGTKHFRDVYAKWLRGANIVMIPDNDDAGKAYAKQVVAAVSGIADTITVFLAKEGKDARDHFKAGHGLEDFVRTREMEPQLGLTVIHMEDVKPVPVDWLWEPYVPLNYGVLVDGDGDVGKSFMSAGLAATISNGFVPTGEPIQPGNIVAFASEDEPDDTIAPRLEAFGADMTRIKVIPELFPLDGMGLDRVRRIVAEYKPVLVIFDPILAYIGVTVNINAANEVRPVLDGLRRIYSRYHCAGWHIRHERKPNNKEKAGVQGHHEGLGSVDIRNAHRSQLVVRWHPTDIGLRVISHEKHNLSEQGDCFGYRFNRGEFEWTPYVERPDEWGTKPAESWIDATELGSARALIEQVLGKGPQPWSEIDRMRGVMAVGVSALRRMRAMMRLQITVQDRVQLFSLPGDYDLSKPQEPVEQPYWNQD